MAEKKKRIQYLDGHRGLAILLVVFFHAYARWTGLVPYGAEYADIPVFKYGKFGVELFFLISGFVILMTLEKCSGAKVFLYQRWLRLFPAMLICSGIVFATSGFFSERPGGALVWESLLPGLTFIEPSWWSFLLGHPVDGVEGAFWSLYVEFKFYVFAAIVYYWRGRNTLIFSLIVLFLLAAFVRAADKGLGVHALSLANDVLAGLSFRYFGWFAAGAAFYIFSQDRSIKWFVLGVSVAAVSAASDGGVDVKAIIAGMVVTLLFAASIVSRVLEKLLTSRVLQFFGLISYPLYLIHENIMVASIIKLGRDDLVHLPHVPAGLLPLPVIALLSAVAYVICRYGEPFVKSVLVKAWGTRAGPAQA